MKNTIKKFFLVSVALCSIVLFSMPLALQAMDNNQVNKIANNEDTQQVQTNGQADATQEEPLQCIICLEKFLSPETVVMPCDETNHTTCKPCARKWLCGDGSNFRGCPYCKNPLATKEYLELNEIMEKNELDQLLRSRISNTAIVPPSNNAQISGRHMQRLLNTGGSQNNTNILRSPRFSNLLASSPLLQQILVPLEQNLVVATANIETVP